MLAFPKKCPLAAYNMEWPLAAYNMEWPLAAYNMEWPADLGPGFSGPKHCPRDSEMDHFLVYILMAPQIAKSEGWEWECGGHACKYVRIGLA